MLLVQSSIASQTPVLRPVREALGRLRGGFGEALGILWPSHCLSILLQVSTTAPLLTTHCLSIVIQVLKKVLKSMTLALPLSQHSNTSFEKDLLLTTHCLSIVIQVLKKVLKKTYFALPLSQHSNTSFENSPTFDHLKTYSSLVFL